MKNIILIIKFEVLGIDLNVNPILVDFIDINILDFHKFNIAEICIASGVIVLLYIILLKYTNDTKIRHINLMVLIVK